VKSAVADDDLLDGDLLLLDKLVINVLNRIFFYYKNSFLRNVHYLLVTVLLLLVFEER
jgi:hypothetical protein